MRATLTYNLADADDALEHYRAIRSLDMALALWTFNQKIKQLVDTSEDGKYIDEEHLWNAWHEVLEEYHLTLDKLVI